MLKLSYLFCGILKRYNGTECKLSFKISLKLKSQWFILLDILFANSVKELYKYLELEEINHFDDQRHLQNLK